MGLVLFCGCERGGSDGRSNTALSEESYGEESYGADPLPDALLVRFEARRGKGLSRESWEIEILQMAGEVKVRGSLRTPESAIPIYRDMSPLEYSRFWSWFRSFPLERVVIDPPPGAAEQDWVKTLNLDLVLGSDRIRSNHTWRRALREGNWLGELENRLHVMVLDYAEEELDRIGSAPPAARQTTDAVREALETLGEDPSSPDLPGGD
jgi:hypothetical protein